MAIVLEFLVPILALAVIIWAAIKSARKKDPGEADQAYREMVEAKKGFDEAATRMERATEELLRAAKELDTTRVLMATAHSQSTCGVDGLDDAERRDRERRQRVGREP